MFEFLSVVCMVCIVICTALAVAEFMEKRRKKGSTLRTDALWWSETTTLENIAISAAGSVRHA